MLLPFIKKINTTPNTERKIETFCKGDVVSFKKTEAAITVTIGVNAYKIPPSAAVACWSPNDCSVKNPSGYMVASNNALYKGLPRYISLIQPKATGTEMEKNDAAKRKASVSSGLA